MEELTKAFSEETGISTELVLGSSGKLTAQISQGAPFDVFVSADMKYPEKLYLDGLTTAAPKVYANGKLVLWSLQKKVPHNLEFLTNAETVHVAIPNPKNAPYGLAARQALQHQQVYEKVKEKLVYGESISQANQFIISGTAEVGFTAKSVVLSPELKGKGNWVEVAEESYAPIRQGVVVVKKQGKKMAEAEKFFTFLFSDKARNILQRYGYSTN